MANHNFLLKFICVYIILVKIDSIEPKIQSLERQIDNGQTEKKPVSEHTQKFINKNSNRNFRV